MATEGQYVSVPPIASGVSLHLPIASAALVAAIDTLKTGLVQIAVVHVEIAFVHIEIAFVHTEIAFVLKIAVQVAPFGDLHV